MPNTADAPYRACLSQVLARAPWKARLGAVHTHPDPLRAAAYYEILRPHAHNIDIWETHYVHALDDLDAVVTWVSGAALTPYLGALESGEKAAFLADYKDAARAMYPPQADGQGAVHHAPAVRGGAALFRPASISRPAGG